MPLYDDPKLIKQAKRLLRSGLSRKAAALEMGVAYQTVRKMVDPDFVEAERQRARDVDAARSPRWDNETYREYQTAYGKRPERIAQIVEQRRGKANA